MRVGEWKKHQVSTMVPSRRERQPAHWGSGERGRGSPAKRKTTQALECVGFKGERRGEGG
jgi:hypothetical protein